MKVLFLNFKVVELIDDSSVDAGGASHLNRNLALGLTGAGHQVGFLVYKGASERLGSDSGFDLIETYDKERYRGKANWVTHVLPSLIAGLRKYRPDFVTQSGAGVLTGAMCLAARLVGVPFVFFAVSDWEADGAFVARASAFERIAYRYGLRHSEAIIAQNEYQWKHFAEQGRRQVHVLRTAYSESYPAFGEDKEGEDPYVLWSGNFRPEKGIERLLGIAEATPDISYRITGKQIFHEDCFDALLSSLFDLPNVRQMGYLPLEELYALFHGAAVLLNTSTREGFPTAFIDAWYYGVPTVTVGYDPDRLISEHSLGIVCGEEAEVPHVLRGIISNEIEIDPTNIREYVQSNHSPMAIADRFIATLGDLRR